MNIKCFHYFVHHLYINISYFIDYLIKISLIFYDFNSVDIKPFTRFKTYCIDYLQTVEKQTIKSDENYRVFYLIHQYISILKFCI